MYAGRRSKEKSTRSRDAVDQPRHCCSSAFSVRKSAEDLFILAAFATGVDGKIRVIRNRVKGPESDLGGFSQLETERLLGPVAIRCGKDERKGGGRTWAVVAQGGVAMGCYQGGSIRVGGKEVRPTAHLNKFFMQRDFPQYHRIS